MERGGGGGEGERGRGGEGESDRGGDGERGSVHAIQHVVPGER